MQEIAIENVCTKAVCCAPSEHNFSEAIAKQFQILLLECKNQVKYNVNRKKNS